MGKKNSSDLNKFVGFSNAAGTGGLSLATSGGDMEKQGKQTNKLAGNSIQVLGEVDPVTGYANENYGNKYLDYRPASERKAEEAAAQLEAGKKAEADKATADLEEQRKRARNSIFQTEGTGGVLTNSVSSRQSYFGN